jgi:hypothetical protein
MAYGIKEVVKDTLTGKAEFVSRLVHEKRMAICMACPHLKNKIKIGGGNCGLCGCFIKSKTKYKKSQCPDNPPRWLAEK